MAPLLMSLESKFAKSSKMTIKMMFSIKFNRYFKKQKFVLIPDQLNKWEKVHCSKVNVKKVTEKFSIPIS